MDTMRRGVCRCKTGATILASELQRCLIWVWLYHSLINGGSLLRFAPADASQAWLVSTGLRGSGMACIACRAFRSAEGLLVGCLGVDQLALALPVASCCDNWA